MTAPAEHSARAEFRALRKALGLRQGPCGDILGLSRRAVMRREAGLSPIRPPELLLLRHLFNEHERNS